MSTKLITKIIPKTHKYILLFLATLFFFVFFTFIALLEGIRVENFTFNGVKIQELYLKWDNALIVRAKKIDLNGLHSEQKPFDIKPIRKLPDSIRTVQSWVESIHIDQIQYKNFSMRIEYIKDHKGIIGLQFGKEKIDGQFLLTPDFLICKIHPANIGEGMVSGFAKLDLKQSSIRSDVKITAPDTPAISVYLRGDNETLSFDVRADGNFTTVRPIIGMFNLDSKITPWIADYAKFTSAELKRLGGSFRYDQPQDLLSSLYAEGTVNAGEYTFAQGFEPVKAPRIALSFRQGKLAIRPIEGTFYTLPTEKSSVIIDFTTPHTMLSALIHTKNGQLNQSILDLLSFYEIHLPLRQLSGRCDVDLNVTVNLYGLETTVKGTFKPTDSEIQLDTMRLKTQGGVVNVDRSKISFSDFSAQYADALATASVNGEYDASNDRGIVSIDLTNLKTPEFIVPWNTKELPTIRYIIGPGGDKLECNPSSWKILDKKLSLNGFKIPFDYRTGKTALRALPFTYSQNTKGSLNADLDTINDLYNIRIRFNTLKDEGISLSSASLDADINATGNNISLSLLRPSSWLIHNLPVTFSSATATLSNSILRFERVETTLGNYLQGIIGGKYDTASNKGEIRLSETVPLSPKMANLVDAGERILFRSQYLNNSVQIDAPSFKARFNTIPAGWKIALGDISLLARISPLLRRYELNEGNVDLYYTGANDRYTFSGEVIYPYKIMLVNGEPLSRYRFNGNHSGDTFKIRVNDRVTISHTPDQTNIVAKNSGLNLPELFKFLAPKPGAKNETNSSEDRIVIHASNTYLSVMKNRRIVADTMDGTLSGGNFDATLSHMNGTADMKIRNGIFWIDGNGFNDRFMEHLFAFSEFRGGTFSFRAQGSADQYEGVMRIEKTTLLQYRLLNNILAFINTVPSLATFSLPNYNAYGLPVSEAYAHFNYKNDTVSVDNFTLNSPEIKIVGEGGADLNNNTLNGKLTLKTDIGSKLGKIPLVGYILLGNDGSVSTTLTLSGNLDKPKIETSIAKEAVTAPFNILKRTVIYPFLWILPDEKKR